MKPTLIVAVSILSTLASGLALQDLSRRGTVIRPEIAVLVNEDNPFTTIPCPVGIAGVTRWSGAHTTRALLGFVVPPAPERGYPACGNTWNSRPWLDVHKGSFLALDGPVPATVVEDFGLTFPCRATTTRLGFDVSPIGDNDYVIWDITKGGFIITCG
ncbi:hypothetical protein B9Z19DRAFT_1122519 [Tuber borchii]|uniref:Phosphatidylglycerol/phosphatidylinositol transfer protein n=1 Tax=Tuber borchii TaxID=42251 RepID=A0A2T7A049_TUBBO|nr:hypothetical protein B9Z19DRAFT_1122519 [Tuber borchii]